MFPRPEQDVVLAKLVTLHSCKAANAANRSQFAKRL